MRLRIACCAIFAFAASAAAQTARVSGVVVDERQVPVQGAIVQLSGDMTQTTEANGRFQFDAVIHGRYLATVTAIGHQMRSFGLSITGDTTFTVALTRRSVTLDTMIVRPRNIRIRGTAVDSATGMALMQAQATLYPGGRFIGALSGTFTFDSVSPGPVTIIVEGAEHLPARVEFEAGRDTSFQVRLGIDSIALRMIAMQVKRLETRSQTLLMPKTALNRDLIEREHTISIGELITRKTYEDPFALMRAPPRAPDQGCFFLDDRKVTREVFGTVPSELVERVEIYRQASGTAAAAPRMIRVYTRRYVATLPRQETLAKVIYMSGTRVACV
jgi:hypothetical protein